MCLGSSGGTVKDSVDELRRNGEKVGLLEVRSYRPFPKDAIYDALRGLFLVSRLAPRATLGGAPPLFAEVAAARRECDVELRSYVYGLGGRDLHPEDVEAVFHDEISGGYLGLRGEPCRA